MRILIVDDEALARERLRRMLEEETEHTVVGEAGNGQEALQKIETLHPEIVLLDIRMPGIDGLEVARHLVGMEHPPAVIFITAYDDYALEAFQVNAVDYLVKPVRSERLAEALKKAHKPNKVQWKELNRDEEGETKARTHISSRTRRGIILVPIQDVYFFRAEHKYVTVAHQDGSVLIEDTLKELETEFEGSFFRIHRNCLVAKHSIQALEKTAKGKSFLTLKGLEEPLEVSRRHLAGLRQLMSGDEKL